MSRQDTQPTPEEKSRYDKVKEELVKMLAQKRAADKQLAQLEVQIYSLEGAYLTETNAHNGGNVVHGFDGYLKNQTAAARKKYELTDADRVFSSSSTTYQKSLDLLGEGDESAAGDEAPGRGTPAASGGPPTVILPPAPRNPELSAAQHKKNRDREYQRRKRASAALRRSTTEISDEESVGTGRKPAKRARMEDD